MATGVSRAVLDTSVLVPWTTRRDLQQLAEIGLYEAIWSTWVVAELNRVLTVRWLRANGCDLSDGALRSMSTSAKNMMRILLGTFTLIDPPVAHEDPWDALADPDDAPVWGTAVASRADYVVSDDVRHFPPQDEHGRHWYQGVEYIRAKTFIRLLLDETPTVHDEATEATE